MGDRKSAGCCLLGTGEDGFQLRLRALLIGFLVFLLGLFCRSIYFVGIGLRNLVSILMMFRFGLLCIKLFHILLRESF